MATEIGNDTKYIYVEKVIFELTWVKSKTGEKILKIVHKTLYVSKEMG